MSKIVSSMLFFLCLVFPAVSYAQAASAECKGNAVNRGQIDCSGSTSANNSSSGSNNSAKGPQRRSYAFGEVPTKNLKYSDFSPNYAAVEEMKDICDSSLAAMYTNLDCPEPTTNTPQPQNNQQTAQMIAEEFFKTIELPTPQPKMSSPDGLCGGIHSLDLQIPDEYIFTSSTPLGVLTIHAYGQSVINWGDNKTNKYNSTGAPYPDSEISHTWSVKGNYNIQSTVNWSADWQLGTIANGTVTERQTTATINNWQVKELQAVLR